jgi:hypothetical protein
MRSFEYVQLLIKRKEKENNGHDRSNDSIAGKQKRNGQTDTEKMNDWHHNIKMRRLAL